ncbi:unnamed protein product, partial [Parnassius mnemosyne]
MNHETETAEKQEDLEIDAFEDVHTDLEDDLPLLAFGSKSNEQSNTAQLKKKRKNIKNCNDDTEPSVKKIRSNSTDTNINVVRKEKFDFEGPTIKSSPKVKRDNQPIKKKGKHPANIMKRKNLKRKNVNILT